MHPLETYVKKMQHDDVARHVGPGMYVLDVGCGEGTLSRLMVDRGAFVVGVDISEEKINHCREAARAAGQEDKTEFVVGDAEALPFTDSSFDLVVSVNMLERLSRFDKGLSESMRVTKKKSVVVIPTLLNMCSWVEVGGGSYYLKHVRSFFALLLGFFMMVWALLGGDGGVALFRFPWVLGNRARRQGFIVLNYSPSSLCLPFFAGFLPVIQWFDTYKTHSFLRNLGYSTTYVIEKKEQYGPTP